MQSKDVRILLTGNSLGSTFFEVSGKSHSDKKCRKGAIWDISNIHFNAKYQKIDAGPFGAKKNSEKNEKFEQSHSAEKSGKVL